LLESYIQKIKRLHSKLDQVPLIPTKDI